MREIDYLKVIKALVKAHVYPVYGNHFYDVARQFAKKTGDKELHELIDACECGR